MSPYARPGFAERVGNTAVNALRGKYRATKAKYVPSLLAGCVETAEAVASFLIAPAYQVAKATSQSVLRNVDAKIYVASSATTTVKDFLVGNREEARSPLAARVETAADAAVAVTEHKAENGILGVAGHAIALAIQATQRGIPALHQVVFTICKRSISAASGLISTALAPARLTIYGGLSVLTAAFQILAIFANLASSSVHFARALAANTVRAGFRIPVAVASFWVEVLARDVAHLASFVHAACSLAMGSRNAQSAILFVRDATPVRVSEAAFAFKEFLLDAAVILIQAAVYLLAICSFPLFI